MNEVSKCADINCSSFDNLHYPLEDVNTEIWDLKATVRKLLLSSLDMGPIVSGVYFANTSETASNQIFDLPHKHYQYKESFWYFRLSVTISQKSICPI